MRVSLNDPAFPRPISHLPPGTDEWADSQKGMSIRCYAAIAAMNGILGSAPVMELCAMDRENVAKSAVEMADALMAELEQAD